MRLHVMFRHKTKKTFYCKVPFNTQAARITYSDWNEEYQTTESHEQFHRSFPPDKFNASCICWRFHVGASYYHRVLYACGFVCWCVQKASLISWILYKYLNQFFLSFSRHFYFFLSRSYSIIYGIAWKERTSALKLYEERWPVSFTAKRLHGKYSFR